MLRVDGTDSCERDSNSGENAGVARTNAKVGSLDVDLRAV